MSDESLIDDVRDQMMLPEAATPAEILAAVRERRNFLRHQKANGKIIQRNGAERELQKLRAIISDPPPDGEEERCETDFEIACELLEFEAHLAGSRGPIRKHELRVRGAKLRARVEAMSAGDRRDIRAGRLADAMALLMGPEEAELRDIDGALEGAKNRVAPVAADGVADLAGDLATLRARIERLPEGTKRADFLRRHASITAALTQRRDALEVESLAAALQAATGKISTASAAELERVRADVDALRPALEKVAAASARATLLAKHGDALGAIAARGEQLGAEALAAGLQALAGKIATLSAAQLAGARDELEAIRLRIEKISAAAGQAALQAKHREAAALLARRSEQLEVSAIEEALEAVTAKIPAVAAAQLGAVRAELEAIRPRLEKISADAKPALQEKYGAALAALAARGQQFDVAALEEALQAAAAKIPGLTAVQLDAARTEFESLRLRIEKIPAGPAQAGLQEKHRAALATLAARAEQLDVAALESALQSAAEKISGLPAAQLAAMRAELDTLRGRIEKIPAARQAPLRAKHQEAVAALEARRAALAGTELMVAVEAGIAKGAAAAGPALAAVTKDLQDFIPRLAQLPETPARNALEQKLQEAIRACEARREVFEIETQIADLAQAIRSPDAPDDLEDRREKLNERIRRLPAGPVRSQLAQKLADLFPAETEPALPPVKLEPGEVLRLRPAAAKGLMRFLPLIAFVARSRFVLGRFPTAPGAAVSADFSCPTDMKKISREHVVLQRSGRDILASDPGTVNGSWIGKLKLEAKGTAVKFAPEQEITLGYGPVLTVVAQHLAAAAPQGPSLVPRKAASFRAAEKPSLLTGAVRFVPKPAMEPPALVAWIFTDATLGSAATNAVVLPGDFPPTLGRVHHWDGAFWFENLSSPAVQFAAAVESGTPTARALAPNEVVALHSGDTLRLGAATYTVEIAS